MRHNHLMKGAVLAATLGIAGTAAAQTAPSGAGWVNPLENRYVTGPPLQVCDEGAFFVGGVPKVTTFASSALTEGAPQQIIIGQAYVQFQIPKKRRQWPLVMVHGSTHTGAALDATPDGREGWFAHAVRNHLATFVMDQPGRGRSGFDESVLHEARITGNLTLIPSIGRITDNGAWTTWFGHLLPAGATILNGTLIRHGDAGDPDPAEDPANPSEAHGNYPPAYPIPPVPNSIDPAIEARLGAIGPAPNPVNDTYLALRYYKQLVPNGEATLPGSICATCTPTTVGPADTWSPRALAELVEGLGGAIVSPHSQSTSQVFHMVRILKEHGKLGLLKGIIIPEGGGTNLAATGLTGSDFDHIPFLLVNGDYRPFVTRQVNRAAAAAMNASPTRTVGPALVLDIEDPQFEGRLNGQTHMNMLGRTNIALFDFFLDWASKNIDNPFVPGDCEEKVKKSKEK
ncbi:MAG TPA: hypothetical protein VF879_02505 [Nitrospirales bacterium]